MIYIIEKESKKVSGNTSLFLSFLFNQDIIDIIKKSGPCYYNKDSKMWEVPISSLSHLLDTLTYYDDITLVAQEEEKEKEEIKPKLEFKTKPFPYQVEGITYGLNCKKWLLLDSPGLGKTLQAIYLAEELKAHHGLKKCLIVCGVASLRANWEKEIKKHSTQDCIIVGKKINSKGRVVWDTVAKRAQQLNNKIDEFFIILNIETLRSDEVIEALKRNVNKIDMIILDEAHKCLVGDTLIDTNIGKLKIEEIVKNHIQCEVKTLNIKNQEVEYKPINEYFELSTTELIELTIQKEDSTIITLTCTPDHKVYTHNRGYVEASQLKETDILEVLK